jgi:hypothetical protein
MAASGSTKMPMGKQALRAFMGLPAVSMPPRDKKADFDRFRAWAESRPNPESLTVADFVKYNKGPYVAPKAPPAPLVDLLKDGEAPLVDGDGEGPMAGNASGSEGHVAKKAKIEALPSGLATAGANAAIKDVMAILEPVSTYKPHALPIDDLINAATALVGAAGDLEKAYKTAGAKAVAEAISENVKLAKEMKALVV